MCTAPGGRDALRFSIKLAEGRHPAFLTVGRDDASFQLTWKTRSAHELEGREDTAPAADGKRDHGKHHQMRLQTLVRVLVFCKKAFKVPEMS